MTIKIRCLLVVMFAALLFLPVSIQAVQPLTLEESISIALKNSLVINIAKEGAKGAEARKREAITGFLPKFSTSYSYTRSSMKNQAFYLSRILPPL